MLSKLIDTALGVGVKFLSGIFGKTPTNARLDELQSKAVQLQAVEKKQNSVLTLVIILVVVTAGVLLFVLWRRRK